MTYALLAILAAAAGIAFAGLFVMNREIRRLSKALKSSRRSLTTVKGNAALEALCEAVNSSIDAYKEAALRVQKHEARLRDSIANISHDLRTPLTAMLGYLEMAKTNPEKAAGYAVIIESRCGVLRELVEAFYELSIADDDRDLPLETIDANAILTNALLGSHALFAERGIAPTVNLPEAPVPVLGNALAFERVCQNLIQNALKYAVDKVEISFSEAGGERVLSFSNNSHKLTEDDMPRLFDRFYTADRSRSGGSTGLGLYLVKALAEKMGGRVAAELSGDRFTIRVLLRARRA